MIENPVLEELRAIRRRLAEEHHFDIERYAMMLREVAQSIPGTYITQPILPQTLPLEAQAKNDEELRQKAIRTVGLRNAVGRKFQGTVLAPDLENSFHENAES